MEWYAVKTDCRINRGLLSRYFFVPLFVFVTKKALGCWEGLCDKKTSQTLPISWHLINVILSFRVLVVSPSKVSSGLDAF